MILLKFAHEQWKLNPDATQLRVPMATFLRETGLDASHNYAGVKARLTEMMGVIVDWGPSARSSDDGEERTVWQAEQLLGPVSFIQKGERGALEIEWTYMEKLREQLKTYSSWSQLRLATYLTLKSYPAVALYELGCRYLTSAPHYLSVRIPLAKAVPFLTGKPLQIDTRNRVPKLPAYRYFKRDTIFRGLEELHQKQDHFKLELREHFALDGRTVEAIQFKVIPLRPLREPALTEGHDAGAVQKAVDLGVALEIAQRLYTAHGSEALLMAASATATRVAATDAPPLANPAGYFVDELKSGRAKRALEFTEPRVTKPTLQETKDRLRAEYCHALAAAALAFYEAAPAARQADLRARYEREVFPKLPEKIQAVYRAGGMNKPNSRQSIVDWVSRTFFRAEPEDADLLAFMVTREISPRADLDQGDEH